MTIKNYINCRFFLLGFWVCLFLLAALKHNLPLAIAPILFIIYGIIRIRTFKQKDKKS